MDCLFMCDVARFRDGRMFFRSVIGSAQYLDGHERKAYLIFSLIVHDGYCSTLACCCDSVDCCNIRKCHGIWIILTCFPELHKRALNQY